jgi:hypothetical protein
MALDSYGDVYVAVVGPAEEDKGHVDIFDRQGSFITELHIEDPGEPKIVLEPRGIAVDSKGYLYVYSEGIFPMLLRYDPDPEHYNPAGGEIAYKQPASVVAGKLIKEEFSDYAALAVDPATDHLFVNVGVQHAPNGAIQEFGTGESGNPLVDENVAEVCCFDGPGLAIDSAHGRLYATDQATVNDPLVIRVFELAAPHAEIEEIDGSTTPEGSFITDRALSLAADEATGNIFAYDEEKLNVIYELTEQGEYLASIEHKLSSKLHKLQVVVDNGANSPHGAFATEGRYLWATAAPGGVGHAFAFAPANQCAPAVESAVAVHVGETEALLGGEVEPCQLPTTYRIEYVSEQQFGESEFEGATLAGEGTIPAGGNPVKVAGGATGLVPGTRYRFRVRATNELGSDEGEGAFKTYPSPPPPTFCPNAALRTGSSALLPDCRAFELVTPANTNGLVPFGLGSYGALFLSPTASTDGDRLSFRIEGGIIPGTEGTGSLNGDPYLATRGEGGWSTVGAGGKGSEFNSVEPGGHSPDQAYSLWRGVVNGAGTTYLRYPDGHSEPLGQGNLGTDPQALPGWISPGGTHIVFSSNVHLEKGVQAGAVYDRTGSTTHVVSLLPNDAAPSQAATYLGSSQDGRGIAFTLGPKLYLRYNDEQTFEIGEGLTFEGIAEGGRRIFYLKEGKLDAFDVEAGVIHFVTSSSPTVVNIARGGARAYFVSTAKLPSAPNPLGKEAEGGEENLYLSREGTISFVGILTERDVVGEPSSTLNRDGLGRWTEYVNTVGALPEDPSRTSYDGSVLLFSSRSPLTGYDNAGQAELYRYDSGVNTLICISCNPTEAPALAGAVLQTVGEQQYDFPTWGNDRIENLTSDGRRAFFESTEALVSGDVDGRRDVYEWEAQGLGSCAQPGGCLFLVSSGRSAQDDYLYGVSENGNDVFIDTNDLLVPGQDPDETRSIYDARVDGGFASSSTPGECLGEACQPTVAPPERPAQILHGFGNLPKPKPHCRKGRRAVRRHGRWRCVKKRHGANHDRKHHRSKATGKGRKTR